MIALKWTGSSVFGASSLTGCGGSVDQSILLFTDSYNKGLYGVSSDTGTLYTVGIKRTVNPIAIHYNELDERIYWTDVTLKEIRSTSLDGQDDVTLRVLSNTSIPDGITIDAISGILFYTDAGNHLIALMSLDGRNHAVVIDEDLDQPRAIVPDPMKGHIYWTDWGKFPKIETSNYDGTERKELITTRLLWPNALAIDFTGQLMYWGDAGTHYIERSKLDGTSRTILYYETTAHYFSLLLQSDKLYYTDWQRKSVMQLRISGDENSTAIGNVSSSAVRMNDISRLKAKPQYPRTNACSKNNGGCSHICLPRPMGKHICRCPSGLYLGDEMNCGKQQQQQQQQQQRQQQQQQQHQPDSTGRINCAPLVPDIFMTILPYGCTTQSVPYGTECSVQCKDGFVYSGLNKALVCSEYGEWSADVLECIDIRRPTIHNCPENSLVTTGKGKDTVAVTWPGVYATDNSGVEPEVFSSMESGVKLKEGEYTVNIFAVDHAGLFKVCHFTITVLVSRCGAVPVPKRGYILSGWCPDYYGATCTIACNTGYQLSSKTVTATMECDVDDDLDNVWKGDDIKCEPITCPAIISPNVEVTGCVAPVTAGDVCEQTCIDGFGSVYGTNLRMCKYDGMWSGQDLICKKKSMNCPKLSPVSHSFLDGCSPPFTVGSVCERVCDAGYEKEGQGSGIRVCRPDGTWSGHDISCSKSTKGLEQGPKANKEPYKETGQTGSSLLMTALLVVVVTLILGNIGIFIHLQKRFSSPVARKQSTDTSNGSGHDMDDTAQPASS